MGGKSAPTPPAPPDPVQLANAQSAANKETAIAQSFLNNTDQFNPLGSSTFTGFLDPETGEQRFRQNINLTPEGQAGFDAEQAVTRGTNELAAGQLGRLGDAFGSEFSFDGLPAAPQGSDAARQRVEDALFNRFSGRINEQFGRDQEALNAQLANQGINIDSNAKAFGTANQLLGEQRNDALENAANQAVLAGGQEQSRLFGLGGAERDRAIQEQSFLRNIPLNEIGALLGTGQVGLPQFSNPTQTGIAGTDVIGAQALASNVANQNFQSQLANQQAGLGGLFGLGGTLGGAALSGPFGGALGAKLFG